MPNTQVENHSLWTTTPSFESIDMSNLADSFKELGSQGARSNTLSKQADAAGCSKESAAAIAMTEKSLGMNTLSSLSVREGLRTAHLKPPQDNEKKALDRLWASSSEVDHQLESIRNHESKEDILKLGSEVQDEILKKGTCYRSFFTRSKSARATVA
jgi:hypothetical protein